MKIGLFAVSAALGEQLKIGKSVVTKVLDILKGMERDMKISELITTEESAKRAARSFRDEVCGGIIVPATGGTNGFIRTIGVHLEKPTLIMANPSSNSLPASLEAYAALKELGMPVKVSYSTLDSKMISDVEVFSRVCRAMHKLEESRLGCVGEDEPWVLTSKGGELIKRRIGPELLRFELTELLNLSKKVNPDEARRIADELTNKFGEVIEPREEDLLNSARVYLAMRELALTYDLSAIAVSHDLIKHGVIGCLGASLCNDSGIPAGYEVDPNAMITMMIVTSLTNEPSWMANPVRIDENTNELTLAHCEIPTKMLASLEKSALRSYFDTRTDESVAIQGPLLEQRVTLARIGGKGLDKMLITTGRIVRSDMRDPDLCRTQAVVRLDGKIEEFIEECLGNHQILAYGDLSSLLVDFCTFKNIEPIPVA